jgi:hypothetical protein
LIDFSMTRPVSFPLGQKVITANASLRLSTEEVLTALCRHASGDWGDLCPRTLWRMTPSLREGGRHFSAYGKGEARFWIITEADRSITTVFFPKTTDILIDPRLFRKRVQ